MMFGRRVNAGFYQKQKKVLSGKGYCSVCKGYKVKLNAFGICNSCYKPKKVMK